MPSPSAFNTEISQLARMQRTRHYQIRAFALYLVIFSIPVCVDASAAILFGGCPRKQGEVVKHDHSNQGLIGCAARPANDAGSRRARSAVVSWGQYQDAQKKIYFEAIFDRRKDRP